MSRTEIPGKSTPERIAIAAQLRQFREYDTNPNRIGVNYKDGSSLTEYLYVLGGLANFMKYVKSISPEKGLFIDAGGGYGMAAAQLQRSPLGEGLDVRITTLGRRRGRAMRFLDNDKVLLTSAERFDGIEDESVSGMLAVSSFSYGRYPDLIVKSIDRVLKPGAPLKATFPNTDNVQNGEINQASLEGLKHGSRVFREAFEAYGYDVIDGESQYISARSLLLAIKPGEKPHISARDLIRMDNGLEDGQEYMAYARTREFGRQLEPGVEVAV